MAGGNFGIVTEFEFRLHELGPTVLAGLAMFPMDRAPEVLHAWRDWADDAPDELSTGCVVITAPPAPFVPIELQSNPVLGIPVLWSVPGHDGRTPLDQSLRVAPLR